MKLTKNIAKITAAVAGAVALGTFATATTANADSVYTVQSGDTLSSISYKLGHDLTYVDSLASLLVCYYACVFCLFSSD